MKTALQVLLYLGGVALVFFVFVFAAFFIWEASTGLHREAPSPDGAYQATLRVHSVRAGQDISVDVRPRFDLFRHTVYHALDPSDPSPAAAAAHMTPGWRGPKDLTISCSRCQSFRVLQNQSAWHTIRITLIGQP